MDGSGAGNETAHIQHGLSHVRIVVPEHLVPKPEHGNEHG